MVSVLVDRRKHLLAKQFRQIVTGEVLATGGRGRKGQVRSVKD